MLECLNRIIPPNKVEGVVESVFQNQVQPKWFCKGNVANEAENAVDTNEMAFIIRRNAESLKWGWAQFNQEHSDTDPPQVIIGYMPLILAPAHEMDTLNTVVQRCKYIAEANEQMYVVLTVDEALYSKLMAHKCSNLLI